MIFLISALCYAYYVLNNRTGCYSHDLVSTSGGGQTPTRRGKNLDIVIQ